MPLFRSIKHYFLMDLGDFFVQFMDLAEDEMKKNMDGILVGCLVVFQFSVAFFFTGSL